MKKTLNLAIILLLAGSLFGQVPVQKDEIKIINNKFFIDNVWDYNKSKKLKYKGTKPIIIDFYATWCVPCKAIHPILVELQKEYGGKITIYQINVDKEPEITDLFKIENIPALVFIKDSKNYSVVVGKKNKEQLKALIDNKFYGVPLPTVTPTQSNAVQAKDL